ncbi:MAG TPA: hypothetical protein PL155_00070 [Candidatus Omnitrophota bacterium]|nr:hypothetical protein [Candidatus Omnitrophota bacterium]HPD85118.1 hypothetical protein [Candidatus Omnitrophota bacterium]HRZ03976.1 hypothetical protein [Candidatus Omnitrophota bacterium]
MKTLRLAVWIVVLAAVLVVASHSFAQLINYDRLNKTRAQKGLPPIPVPGKAADVAQPPEPFWAKGDTKVTTKEEEAYDVNNDGKMQKAEVKIFLRDNLDEIDKKGGVTVSSPILKAYDKSGDGVVSRLEAEKIRQEVR